MKVQHLALTCVGLLFSAPSPAVEVPRAQDFLPAISAVTDVKKYLITGLNAALSSNDVYRSNSALNVVGVVSDAQWFLSNWYFIYAYRELSENSTNQDQSEMSRLKILTDVSFCQELAMRLGAIDIQSTAAVTQAMLAHQKEEADLIVKGLREARAALSPFEPLCPAK